MIQEEIFQFFAQKKQTLKLLLTIVKIKVEKYDFSKFSDVYFWRYIFDVCKKLFEKYMFEIKKWKY